MKYFINLILLNYSSISTDELAKLDIYCKLDHPIIEFIKNDLKRLPNFLIEMPIESVNFSKQIQDFIINTDAQREFWINQNFDEIFSKYF